MMCKVKAANVILAISPIECGLAYIIMELAACTCTQCDYGGNVEYVTHILSL